MLLRVCPGNYDLWKEAEIAYIFVGALLSPVEFSKI